MTILNAFKKFFLALNGVEPSGANISEVIRNGTSNVQRNNESALGNRMDALETAVTDKSLVLTSSTTDSTKRFNITVDDSGVITATEIVVSSGTT